MCPTMNKINIVFVFMGLTCNVRSVKIEDCRRCYSVCPYSEGELQKA